MFGTALAIGPWLIAAGLAYGLFKVYRAYKSGRPAALPFVIERGAIQKAIDQALAGNPKLALVAATESFHLHFAAGSIEQRLLEAGFRDLERRAKDPNAKLPAVDYIAEWSGANRDQVIAFLEAAGGVATQISVPAGPVTSGGPTALAATALLLCAIALLSTTSSSAMAASPLTPPQQWTPDEPRIVIDSPVFAGPVYESQRSEILLPNSWYQRDELRPGTNFGPQQNCPSCDRSFAPSHARGPSYFGNLRVPSVDATAAAACRVPDRGPVIFVTYYYMQSCRACDEATEATRALAQAGWKVLGFNVDDETGYMIARFDKVNFVPYWQVTVDGKETLRTTDYRRLYDHLDRLSKNRVSYQQPAQYQTAYYQQSCCQPTSYAQPVYYQNCGRRWFPGKYVGRGGLRFFRWLFRRG